MNIVQGTMANPEKALLPHIPVTTYRWLLCMYAQVELLVIDRTGSGYQGANLISTKTEEREG
jgi:hypothetical protein